MKKQLPHLLALVIFTAVLLGFLLAGQSLNHGQFLYSLDDSYIHLAMAKNLVEHGILGVTQHNFTSSTSSPLYTLLLAFIYELTGMLLYIPLILNLVAAQFILLFFSHFLQQYWKTTLFFHTLTILVISFFLTLPTLVFTGMEHTIHLLLALLVLQNFLQQSKEKIASSITKPVILLMLLVGFRYEGLFISLALVLLLLFQGRWKRSGIYLMASLFVPIVYGCYSLSQNWYFLPNSVLLKGNRLHVEQVGGVSQFLTHLFEQIVHNPQLSLFILLFVVILTFRKEFSLSFFRHTIITFVVYFLHLLLARSSWFGNMEIFVRYEAYLIALGIFWCLLLIDELKNILPKKKNVGRKFLLTILVLLMICNSGFLAYRASESLMRITPGLQNIYGHHWPVAKFLKMHYQNEVVALHDIGVVSFFTNIKFVDLMGLTHLEVGGVLKNASLTTKKIAEIIQKNDCKIAIVYEELYQREYDLLPKNWHKVGSWQIKNNVMFHENRFSFYALKKKEIPILRDKLRVYSQCLSPTVVAEFVINDAPGLKNN